MTKRRVKKRTHLGVPGRNGQPNILKTATKPGERTPKSMVIRIGAGEVGPSVSQLAKDMRNVMEPNTASRLKERKANKLRDYTTMAGPLGVTHLILFSRSPAGNTNMKIAIAPKGPTLSFKVDNYSLCKDIIKAVRNSKVSGKPDFMSPPLLVMNNFTSSASSSAPSKNPIDKQVESLITTVFQSLFPPISPQTTPLSSIRRVLLLNREGTSATDASSSATYTINLRHYSISSKLLGLPKALRRLDAAERNIKNYRASAKTINGTNGDSSGMKKRSKGGLPNLGKLEDIGDFLLDPAAAGYTSASDTEIETDAEVEVLQTTTKKVLNKRDRQKADSNKAGLGLANGANSSAPGVTSSKAEEAARNGVEKRAIKLAELGPRMKLRLVKVEEGMCAGKVMWHEFVQKTDEEKKAMEQLWEKRNKEREERRRVQRENVERKRKEKAGKRGARGKGEGDEEDDDEEEYPSDFDGEEWIDDDDDEMDGAGAGAGAEKGDADEDMEDVDDDEEMDDEEDG
ncbi:Brix-domain-containing protein [Aulographum hederae CBS 113979]|uniref:Brix-domain-containing protein n=1 Tax=Aulographum hederae CBS 113979 TaxID=1176131 RepID=A0A6G1H2K0_9PEZI|nr:Brix-domain-containing protein [Aulographum hederae CBS 113979]